MNQFAQVKDIMTDEVMTASPQTPVSEIVEILQKNGFNGIPVVDENKNLLGLVTEYNLVTGQALLPSFLKNNWEQFVSEAQELSKSTAQDVMEKEPLVLQFNQSYEEALSLFNKHHRINPVPVVDAGHRLVGIVSRSDLLKLLKLYGHT